MPKCTINKLKFHPLKRRKIEGNFEGGDVTSDGGALLLREIDNKLKLTEKIAGQFEDSRSSSYVSHSMLQMLRQRVYGIAQGYEDLNDHDYLRSDTCFQTAIGEDKVLASSPTLCRFENTFDRKAAIAIHKIFLESFIDSFSSEPKEIILDFDATDNPVYGNQEGRFYHGYYGHHCFLPLHVFCGSQLLVSYLRPSSRDGALHSWAILSLLVKRLKHAWPNTKIIFRGDGGFCRHLMLNWCDKNGVFYILGISSNKRLKKLATPLTIQAKEQYEKTLEKQKIFTDFSYAAKTWSKERRIISKAEYNSKGSNTRFIITNLTESAKDLYETTYCARGDMENRIKEQLLLFSDRNSSHKWWANQLRLLFSAIAYVLLERLRSLYLYDTKLSNCQVDTMRLKLLKIGAVILKNTRRICFFFSSSYPFKRLFKHVLSKLCPG